MTTAELLEKIEAEGLEWVLDRYESEPTDNDDLAFEFDRLCRLHEKYKEQANWFDGALRKASRKS